MPSARPRRAAAVKASETISDTSDSMSRPRRLVSGSELNAPLVTLSRTTASSTEPSLHVAIKLPIGKLRQAVRAAQPRGGAAQPVSVNSRDQFVGGEILEGKRSRNVKKSYVLESESDEEDEEMDDAEEDDEDAEGDEDDEMDEDAEGDEDADGDVDMDIPPPPPVIKISKASNAKPVISVKPSGKSDGKTVEQKEAQSDDELSELDSDLEDEEEEGMQVDNEEDAEGDEEEIEVVDDEEDEDDLDSDDETPAGGSRASTPDMTKLTKRQRARLEEGGSGHLLALPDEVQVKKHLTAEEHAMRRAEMARRRKNLSEKRNEEEKMETINKLLKKQAPKTNARRRELNGLGGTDATPDGEASKPNPVFVRYISNKSGNSIGVPEEWIGGPAGALFDNSKPQVRVAGS